MENDKLYHHGVKGMKWGVRKKRSIVEPKNNKSNNPFDKYRLEENPKQPKSILDKFIKDENPKRGNPLLDKLMPKRNIVGKNKKPKSNPLIGEVLDESNPASTKRREYKFGDSTKTAKKVKTALNKIFNKKTKEVKNTNSEKIKRAKKLLESILPPRSGNSGGNI